MEVMSLLKLMIIPPFSLCRTFKGKGSSTILQYLPSESSPPPKYLTNMSSLPPPDPKCSLPSPDPNKSSPPPPDPNKSSLPSPDPSKSSPESSEAPQYQGNWSRGPPGGQKETARGGSCSRGSPARGQEEITSSGQG